MNAVSLTPTDEAGIFNISVISTNKDLCANAIVVIINEYPEYLQQFDNTIGIKVMIRPTSPTIINADVASRNGMIGFALGAILVAAAVIAVDLLSKTVKNSDEARVKINARYLGSVPTVEIAQGQMKKKKRPKNGIRRELQGDPNQDRNDLIRQGQQGVRRHEYVRGRR